MSTAQDAAADELPGFEPLAPLIGMLLDRHQREGSSGGIAGSVSEGA